MLRLTLCRQDRWNAIIHLLVHVYPSHTHLFVSPICSLTAPLYLLLGSDDLSANRIIGGRHDLSRSKTLLDHLRRSLGLGLLGSGRSSHGLLNLNRGHASLEHLTNLIPNPTESGRSSDPSAVDVEDEGRGGEEERETGDQSTSPVDSEVGEHLPGEERESYKDKSNQFLVHAVKADRTAATYQLQRCFVPRYYRPKRTRQRPSRHQRGIPIHRGRRGPFRIRKERLR